MNLLHTFLVSLVAFVLFKLLAPYVLDLLLNTVGAVGNMTVVNAVTFALIFAAVSKVNEDANLLNKVGL